jgi:two-component system, chemotaxis family, CheB/CheR fusion protein
VRHGLAGAIQKAARQKRVVTVRGLTVGTDVGTQGVDLAVRPLGEPEALRGMFLVVFSDVAAVPATNVPKHGRWVAQLVQLAELQRKVRQLHEELRSTREDMQTSQEELRSANEELQSTNEELTTSKEEMQSMNEELQTVNGEMQAKLDELSRANNDMKNLLNSTEIATLFLDRAMRFRRFTPQATRVMKLMSRDAGRPVADIASDLLHPGFADEVHEVLRTLVLRSSRERFSALIENLPLGLSILDESGRIVPKSSVVARIAEAKSVDVSAWKVVVGTDAAEREASP